MPRKVLNRAFGSLILHEIPALRIEQFEWESVSGSGAGISRLGRRNPSLGTVNRELDTLRGIFSKAVEWGQLLEHPMRAVKRLKVDNRRTRILSEGEQAALLKACPAKFGRIVRLALITGARIGELLDPTRANVSAAELLLFLETKNDRARRLLGRSRLKALLHYSHKRRAGCLLTTDRTQPTYSVNALPTFQLLPRAAILPSS